MLILSYQLYIFSYAIIVITAIVGSMHVQKQKLFGRLLYLHILLAFCAESIALLTNYINNQSTEVYNTFILLDIPLLLTATLYISENIRTSRQFLYTSILIYLFTWIYSCIVSGITTFANQAFVIGSILVCISYLSILIKYFTQNTLVKNPELIVLFAVFVYYASNIPIFSFLKYLEKNNAELAQNLYIINIILSCLHYSLISIYFLRAGKTKPKDG